MVLVPAGDGARPRLPTRADSPSAAGPVDGADRHSGQPRGGDDDAPIEPLTGPGGRNGQPDPWRSGVVDGRPHRCAGGHGCPPRGREVKTTGDGFLATFDSPARALKCALAIRAGVEALGLEIRAGIHTGECEVLKGDVSGIAVHLAARVLGAAAPGEVLVSGTVRDLLLGSDLHFEDRGRHKLKGIEGEWQLFAAQH